MTKLSSEELAFITELHAMTRGDADIQVSMYDVGEALGMDRGDSTAMAQELMFEELIELKTLSGGIAITARALDFLTDNGLIEGATPSAARLGQEPIIGEADRDNCARLIAAVKKEVAAIPADYPRLEECVIDIKTLEVQLLSPRPKSAIIRAIFMSLTQSLAAVGAKPLAGTLKTFTDT